MSIIRRFHSHLEQLIFRSEEFRQWSRSQGTRIQSIMDPIRDQCQPLDQPKSDEIDDDVMISQSESGKTWVNIKKGKIMLK